MTSAPEASRPQTQKWIHRTRGWKRDHSLVHILQLDQERGLVLNETLTLASGK